MLLDDLIVQAAHSNLNWDSKPKNNACSALLRHDQITDHDRIRRKTHERLPAPTHRGKIDWHRICVFLMPQLCESPLEKEAFLVELRGAIDAGETPRRQVRLDLRRYSS